MFHLTDVWRNWSGSVNCEPDTVEPRSIEEVSEAVAEAEEVRPVGSGHSFSPLVATDGTIVSLDSLTGVVDTDADSGEVKVRAGTTLADLNRELADHGLAMENLGDIDRQTVSGATATGTHGTGEFGTISEQVTEIEMVTGDGDLRTFSEGDDGFGAACVSLGSLGVLTEMTLDAVPSYGLELVRRKEKLDTVLHGLLRRVEQNRNFEFFWFPNTDTAVTKTLNEVREYNPEMPTSGGTLENVAWRALCETSRVVPSKHASRLAARTIREETVAGPSHEVYVSTREVRFNETEYGVPAGDAVDAFREISEVVERHDVAFPVEVRYVEADDIPLSPAYGRDTVFIAVHRYHKKDYSEMFEECEEVFARYDGRPHWGKIHSLTADELAGLYPEWDSFLQVREETDPDGVFLNDHLRSVFGVAAGS